MIGVYETPDPDLFVEEYARYAPGLCIRQCAGFVYDQSLKAMLQPIDRILFPVDFSEHGTGMIPFVRKLAVRYQSEVILLHVLRPLYLLPEARLWPPHTVSLPEWVLLQQTERLKDFGRTLWGEVPVRHLVVEGDPEEQILVAARVEKSRLVAMSTHGYGRFRQFLLGSVTAKILDDFEGPLLTGAHLPEQVPSVRVSIRHVVCALNLGPRSADILTWANRLATDFQAHLHVLHVLPKLDLSEAVVFESRGLDKRRTAVREAINELHRATATTGSTVEVVEGEVPQAICSFGQLVGADLLVIGRSAPQQGHGRLRAHTYAIVRLSSCPVLSV